MHSPRYRQRHTAKNVGHNKASTHEAACYQGVAPIQAQGSTTDLTAGCFLTVSFAHAGKLFLVFLGIDLNRLLGDYWSI